MEDGTPPESKAVHRTIERGESYEIQAQPRLKRSTLLKGKSNESATPFDAFLSGFKTTFSVSEEEDGTGAETDASRDTAQLIHKEDGSSLESSYPGEGGQSSRENPFNRGPDSENHARMLGSEEIDSSMTAGGHTMKSAAFGMMFANDMGHANATFSGDQDAGNAEMNSSSADRDGASNHPSGVNGQTPGGKDDESTRQHGSADDRSDEMRDSQQKMDMKFQAGSARDGGNVSVEYQQQQASFDGDQDDKPLINDDAAEDENDENQVDQENIDPSKMPLSSLFKTTKAKKNKKGKDKDGTDNASVTSDDVTKSTAASELQANSSDGKTDLAVGKDTPAVLYTTENRDATMKQGEGPHLTLSAADGVAVEGQPIKADGALPPETGREKESLLRDHNPEGMICCTIL